MATEELRIRAMIRDELTGPLTRIEGQLRGVQNRVERMGSGRAQRGLVGLDRRFGGMGRTIRGVDRNLRGASRSLNQMATRHARRATLAFTALAGAATGFGLKAAAGIEQTMIALQGFLGSAEAGKGMFDYLRTLNLKTPFELPEVGNAARMLLGFGFAADEVKDFMGPLVDIVAGLGGSGEALNRVVLNMGQIRALGVVTGREMRDFATLGFPIYDVVAEQLGITKEQVRALGDEARLTSDQFIDAFMSMGGSLSRYRGMAEKQMNSLMGLWSNFKDSLTVNLADAAHPLVERLKELMPQATALIDDLLTTVAPPLMGLVGDIVGLVSSALPAIEPLLLAVTEGFSALLTAAMPGLAALEPVVDDLAYAFTDFVEAIVPHIPAFVDALVAVAGILPELVGHLASLMPLVSGVAGLVTAFLGFDGATTVVAGFVAALMGYRLIGPAVTAVWGMASALLGLSRAQAAVAATGGPAAAAAGGWGPTMAGGRAGAARFLGPAAGAVGGGMIAAGGYAGAAEGSVAGLGQLVGGAALTGASIGSFIPGVGTLVGGAVGATAGLAAGAFGRHRRNQELSARNAAYQARGAGGGDTNIDSTVTVAEGAIQVHNPASDIDLQRAIFMGIRNYENERVRRG